MQFLPVHVHGLTTMAEIATPVYLSYREVDFLKQLADASSSEDPLLLQVRSLLERQLQIEESGLL